MGVPGLFSYLIRHYPTAFKTIQDRQALNLDAVYLDGNALLYPISEDTKIPEEIAKNLLSVSQLYASTYACICHIYMDGPAHMGKIRQQRMRRFLYEPTSTIMSKVTQVGERQGEVPIPTVARSQALDIDVPTISEWSPAMFTPGTDMMERIHQYINQHKEEYPDVGIYSSYHEPGEGEHKIIQHIKELSLTHSQENPYRAGIVGKDADLLLLAMSITTEEGWNIQPYILRHNDRLGEGGKTSGYSPTDPIFTVDTSLLRDRILASFTSNSVNQGDNVPSIWNFILATFLVGNDFFPSVPEMSDIYSAIPLILSLSPNLYMRDPSSREGSINWEGFIQYIHTVADTIDTLPKMRSAVYDKWLQPSSKRNDMDVISTDAFGPLYYFHVSNFPVNTDGMILSWLITIQWVFLYYHNGLGSASIAWQYPLSFSPTIRTIASSSLLNDETTWDKVIRLSTRRVKSLSPVQALAAVLPIWLHNLIPTETRLKMDSISQYYPYAFQILNPTGDAIIPIIPYEVVASL